MVDFATTYGLDGRKLFRLQPTYLGKIREERIKNASETWRTIRFRLVIPKGYNSANKSTIQ